MIHPTQLLLGSALRLKRNELLRIAAYLGPDASESIDIEALQRIATERLRLTGAVTAARRAVDDGRPWLQFLGVNQLSCFSARANSTSI